MTLHSPLRNREVLLSYTTLNMGERSCGTGVVSVLATRSAVEGVDTQLNSQPRPFGTLSRRGFRLGAEARSLSTSVIYPDSSANRAVPTNAKWLSDGRRHTSGYPFLRHRIQLIENGCRVISVVVTAGQEEDVPVVEEMALNRPIACLI